MYNTDVIGKLIEGQFVCNRCALQYDLAPDPLAINVIKKHILPYSQTCHDCGKLIVNGVKREDGTPIILFD